ncbi:MAG: hypothetical protein RLZZ22_678 [Pseudomonadota bacterium]|jgi:protein-histidine pros-kinase
MKRYLPSTLFGRLAALLFAAVLASHVLALTLLFELRPPPHYVQAPTVAGAGRLTPPEPPAHGPRPVLHPGLLLDIGVRLGVLMLAAWVGARWLSAPIRQLAHAAQELGKNIDRAPLPETGTAECREATRVFNQMQQRIRQQIAEREHFVAAVSHDLRTPLTRLRLRAESARDAVLRAGLCRDVSEMEALVGATLDHLSGTAAPEPLVLVDMQALVDSLLDDELDCGHRVSLSGQARPLSGQPRALRRCLDNLVGNAIRYGAEAQVELRDSPQALTITVCDRGPGLPPEELDKVMQPFYRVEASRHRDSGGVGLGLAIARDIARRHGGSLSLSNRPQGGLQACLTLPRQP